MSPRQPEKPPSAALRRELMASLGGRLFHEFNVAFALMSLIPLAIAVYVLAARLFTINVFEGLTGLYFFIAVVIALLGFLVGRRILHVVLLRLVDANAKLRQHDVMKSGFVANVAYELRPPLSAVQISLKNVADELLGPLTDPQRKTVETCHHIIDRLTRLTGDLIDAVEVEKASRELQRDVFELQEAVREGLRAGAPYLTAHHVTVTTKFPTQPVLFFGDRGKLLTALGSLIDHAVRWSGEGDVIVIELSSFPQEWRLAVSHNIAPHKGELSRAMETLTRLGGDAEQPLGLGLHLVRDIVALHHGRFWTEGQAGRHGRLIISLPALEPPSGRGS